jgi:hypothetical protein
VFKYKYKQLINLRKKIHALFKASYRVFLYLTIFLFKNSENDKILFSKSKNKKRANLNYIKQIEEII